MSVSASTSEKIYREYMSFFEKAEKHRRWSVFDDIDWTKASESPKDRCSRAVPRPSSASRCTCPTMSARASTSCATASASAWFLANWGYEESKHALSLREYLRKTGQRTDDEIVAYEKQILGRAWNKPFPTQRQMTMYGVIQELTTYVFYKKHKQLAHSKGDELLASIYGFIARDEIAHFGFYAACTRYLLEEDEEGTKRDLAHVFRHFTMPGVRPRPRLRGARQADA